MLILLLEPLWWLERQRVENNSKSMSEFKTIPIQNRFWREFLWEGLSF